ncbi:hypothetical protein ACFQ8C_23600 [Streptomyces sp. NPDC056503]|uniref:hypothetical protein n=1 Tax=Streptomyces sp. NPDC056503 TaxID=3345842 RepID=UPI0036A9CB83
MAVDGGAVADRAGDTGDQVIGIVTGVEAPVDPAVDAGHVKGDGLDGGDPSVMSEEYKERGAGSIVGGGEGGDVEAVEDGDAA